MPAFVSHYLFGSSLMQDTLSPTEKLAFLWGAQGPDVLFFQSNLSPLPKVGRQLHQRDMALFLQNCANIAVESGDTVIFAYVSGLISHYALDVTLHPFVYALQRRLVQKGAGRGVHNRIESDIDTALYHHFTGKSLRTFPLHTMSADRSFFNKLSSFWQQALAVSFGLAYPVSVICRSFYSTLGLQTCFLKGTHLRLAAKKIESLMDSPHNLSGNFHYFSTHDSVLNLHRRCWVDHDGICKNDSVLDILNTAAQLYTRLCGLAFAGEDLSNVTDKPYNHGKFVGGAC